MIPIENGAMCKCIKEYIFNRTITFTVGETYQVDLGTTVDLQNILYFWKEGIR